jgi:hypothetical protein
MQVVISIPLAYCILRCTYSEGGVFGFLLCKLRRVPVGPLDSEDVFNTLTGFFRV